MTLASLLNLGPVCDAFQIDAKLFALPPEIPERPMSRCMLRIRRAHGYWAIQGLGR